MKKESNKLEGKREEKIKSERKRELARFLSYLF